MHLTNIYWATTPYQWVAQHKTSVHMEFAILWRRQWINRSICYNNFRFEVDISLQMKQACCCHREQLGTPTLVKVIRKDFFEEVTFKLRPKGYATSKCFLSIGDRKNSGSGLADRLASLGLKESRCDQSFGAKGKGHAMRLDPLAGAGLCRTSQDMMRSLDLAQSSIKSHWKHMCYLRNVVL